MLKLPEMANSVSVVWKKPSLAIRKWEPLLSVNGRIYERVTKTESYSVSTGKTGKELFSTKDLSPANIIADEDIIGLQ